MIDLPRQSPVTAAVQPVTVFAAQRHPHLPRHDIQPGAKQLPASACLAEPPRRLCWTRACPKFGSCHRHRQALQAVEVGSPRRRVDAMAAASGFEDKVLSIWAVADELGGTSRPARVRQVILPLLVLQPTGVQLYESTTRPR